MSSIKKRLIYANKKLKKLGSGTSRIVFQLPNDKTKVIKIAKNLKGLAQNKAEIGISNHHGSEMVAKVFDHDPKFSWLESEYAIPLTKSETSFKNAVGFRFDEFAVNLEKSFNSVFSFDQNPDIVNSEFFKETVKTISMYDLSHADIKRKSSWGTVVRNGKLVPVIIDYGLTGDVYDQFYDY